MSEIQVVMCVGYYGVVMLWDAVEGDGLWA
jgi:hypothetical protein